MTRRQLAAVSFVLALALTHSLAASAVAVSGLGVADAGVADEGTRIVTDGDSFELESGPGQAIRGRTDLPAGTQLSVRVESDQFLLADETTVGRNGTFRTVVDFSDVSPGTEFSVVVYRHDTQLTATEGTVVECTDACANRSADANAETNVTYSGDRLTLGDGPGRVVRGQTDLPPGTELHVRIRSTEGMVFLSSRPATVDDEGRFRATFDLWDKAPGREFRVTVFRSETDAELTTAKGIVVQCRVECDSPYADEDEEPSEEDAGPTNRDDLSVYSTAQGEVVRIPLTFTPNETVTLSVGGENVSYSLDAAVEDGDGDGNVTLLLDTGAVGTDDSPASVADEDDSVSVRNESGPESGASTLDAGEYPLLQYPGNAPSGIPSEDRGALLVRPESDGDGAGTGSVVADFGFRNASSGEAVYRSDSVGPNVSGGHSVETRLGETARIELRTDEAKSATVTVGEFHHDYALSATVRDGNGDERVVLVFNTTAASREGSEAPTLTPADPADEVTVHTERGNLSAAEYTVLAYVGPRVELGADLDGPKQYRLLDSTGLVVAEAGTTPTLPVTDDAPSRSGPSTAAFAALGLAGLLAVVGIALLVGVFEVGR